MTHAIEPEHGNGEIRMLGLRFSTRDKTQISHLVTGPLGHRGVRLIVTCNLDHLYNLDRNIAFRSAYNNAWLRTIDGYPLHIYASRIRGIRIPHVTGADLFAAILNDLSPALHRPFFIVSDDATGRRLTQLLLNREFERDSIAYEVPRFGFEHNQETSRHLARRVRSHRTTHLFLGIGSPKSEIWVDMKRAELGDLFAFGFGAGLDFAAGTRRRAPVWMRRRGLEWFHRVSQEPRRLMPRYSRNLLNFALFIARDQWRARFTRAAGDEHGR